MKHNDSIKVLGQSYPRQQEIISFGHPNWQVERKGIMRLLAYVSLCLLPMSSNAAAEKMPQVVTSTSKVEIDNNSVIVRRNIHPVHSITGMHSHVSGVVVFLTDVHERSIAPDGSAREVFHKAGDVVWSGARTHKLENLSNKPIEVIEIELKHP